MWNYLNVTDDVCKCTNYEMNQELDYNIIQEVE